MVEFQVMFTNSEIGLKYNGSKIVLYFLFISIAIWALFLALDLFLKLINFPLEREIKKLKIQKQKMEFENGN